MKRITSVLIALVVAAASFATQPRTRQTLGLLPYLEQGNLLQMQDVFVTELKVRLKGTNVSLMLPKVTLAKFKKSGIEPRKYVANPKAFTGSDEEFGALIAWIQAQKGSKRTLGKVVINLIDTSTGEIVWADEIRGTGRDAAKNAADRLAAAVRKRSK